MLYISEEQVKSLLEWDSTYKAVEVALLQQYLGQTAKTSRSFISAPNNVLVTMPGHLQHPTYGALACKLVTMATTNHTLEKPLPNIMANIAFFDEVTGELKAIIAGTEITTWRTAAASVVATKYLRSSFDERDSIELAILGAGVQAKIHALAFKHFYPNIKSIKIWNHSAENAEKLVHKLSVSKNDANLKITVASSVAEATENADIIITATSARRPILTLDWIKRGAHINAIGVQKNGVNELELNIYLNGDVFIDNWDGANEELASLTQQGVRFIGEIGGLISGSLKPPLKSKVTIFQSLGMAVEDCAMSRMIFDKFQTNIQRRPTKTSMKD